jgi:hypothetical protein
MPAVWSSVGVWGISGCAGIIVNGFMIEESVAD